MNEKSLAGHVFYLKANAFLPHGAPSSPTATRILHEADSSLRRAFYPATSLMICEPSRTAALGQLDDFARVAGLYARDRNHVKPGHSSVSRLSPAIRHRLITEEEVVQAVLRVHSFGRVEKLVQEVYWRRYWKSWLALRPGVWDEFQKSLTEVGDDSAVDSIENLQSGNAVIDHFAKELLTSGYLHNHARMWFAAWWIHEARLPWQSGAAFFFRHLLDGDPASNTLSWRWVAGLQTPGKTYLARRSNLEKYLAPELLVKLSAGLATFENPRSLQSVAITKPPITHHDSPLESLTGSSATGLWIHEEDLSVETSPLGLESFSSIIITGDLGTWERHQFPATKRQWLADALADAGSRAEIQWKTHITLKVQQPHADTLLEWAQANHLDQVAAIRPATGPLNDSLPALRSALSQAGIRLVLIDRPEDLRIRHFATGGFFQFWERTQNALFSTLTKPSPQKQLPLDFSQ